MYYKSIDEGRLRNVRRRLKIPLIWPFRQKVPLRTQVRVVEVREELGRFVAKFTHKLANEFSREDIPEELHLDLVDVLKKLDDTLDYMKKIERRHKIR